MGNIAANGRLSAGMLAAMMPRLYSMTVHILESIDCHMISVCAVARLSVVKRRIEVTQTL
jgi:hypothetical protein